MEVGLGQGDIGLDGNPAPPLQKRGLSSPKFSVHVCCGQTAGRIKMPLVTEVGFSPGHIVLDGDQPPPPPKWHSSRYFSAMSIVAKRLDGSRCHLLRGRPRPRRHCAGWEPISPAKRDTAATQFSAHVYSGQTVARLSYC